MATAQQELRTYRALQATPLQRAHRGAGKTPTLPSASPMSDFFQHGLISTLHRLVPVRMRDQIESLPAEESITLVLPCHYTEIGTAALKTMIAALREATFLKNVVISMNGIPEDRLSSVKRFWSGLKLPHLVLWNDSPDLLQDLEQRELLVTTGKGLNLWLAIGWLAMNGTSGTVLVHDCDIANYRLDILAALALPVARIGYRFCKGYYSRVREELYGRVTRLFVIPLVRSLVRVLGHAPLLDFIDSFRYPLSGEYSMTVETALDLPVESGWGLEIGSLCEFHRLLDPGAVCQVDLAILYDHKHRALNPEQPGEGLLHSATEIAISLLTHLQREGCGLDAKTLESVVHAYESVSKDFVRRYEHVAILNALPFDSLREARATDAFAANLSDACAKFLAGKRSRALPPWRAMLRSNWTPEYCVIAHHLRGDR
jgi:glucosyl-3-phosphoglycerate synthase